MSSSTDLLSPSDTAADLESTAFVHLSGTLIGTYKTADFASAARLVSDVTDVAENMNHHPDVRLSYGEVTFVLSSHDAGGVTERDMRLATDIQSLADSQGATAGSSRPTEYQLAIDCLDQGAIQDFWRVGLDYDELADEDGSIELVDPRGQGPLLWFQQMDPPRTDRNRIHVDVYVPAADAESRVRELREAGGHLVTADHAPDWWVLADAEGNELCVCTSPR